MIVLKNIQGNCLNNYNFLIDPLPAQATLIHVDIARPNPVIGTNLKNSKDGLVVFKLSTLALSSLFGIAALFLIEVLLSCYSRR